jgi:glucosamine--fructose-6-phosphate aminotransferase (isomerizing)
LLIASKCCKLIAGKHLPSLETPFMCGIVGAVAERNIVPVLTEGLRRLEYRGYDSAGVAVVGDDNSLGLRRTVGKVAELEAKLEQNPLNGRIGVAHTRWATHGGVTEANAHPHVSGGRVAVIHNGIIENFQPIKDEMLAEGYVFDSETDTEVAAHLIHHYLKGGLDLVDAVGKAVKRFEGAYALLVVDADDPSRIVVSRVASPLVVGLGDGENFVASGVPALLPVTQRFIYLEQGDLAEIRRDGVRIVDMDGNSVTREVHETEWDSTSAEKAPYDHFMLKEIFDQPSALADTLYGRVANQRRTFISSHAEPVITRAASASTGSRRCRASRHRSRSRVSTAIDMSWCRRKPCS